MAEKLVAMVGAAPVDRYRKKNDDDFSDRLSSKYTVAILVMFAILVSMTQYVGKPIICWTPAHFHKSWVKFSESYCWVKNTYYLPWENVVPYQEDEEGSNYKEHIVYYQWIPFILLTQAILFYLPNVVWHAFNSRGGVDADSILESAHKLSYTQNADSRESTVQAICRAMDAFLATRRDAKKFGCDLKSFVSATLCRPCGKRFGNYLVVLFMFSKICYLANVIGQFFLLDKLLGKRFSMYGFYVLEDGLEESHNWEDSSHVSFPRVTMCDFEIRRLGNINRYSLQCVLPINLYTEKIYLFIWFWMVFVAIVSFINFFVWFFRFLFRGDRLKFVKNHLTQESKVIRNERDIQMLHRFLDSYLKQDGAFLLRLIAHNTNNITVTEITLGLWHIWIDRISKQPAGSRGDMSESSETTKRPLSDSLDNEDSSDESRLNPDAPLHGSHDGDNQGQQV